MAERTGWSVSGTDLYYFDSASGRVLTTTAGASNAVAALNTDWDTAGNLADRGDTHASGWQNENFCYDAMNRLTDASFDGTGTSAQRCSNGASNVHMTYDAVGNILSKSDTGTYSYGTGITSGAGPHALTSIATSLGCTQSGGCTVDGLANPTYAYDANGNMLSGAGRTVSYTSFNMTKTVTVGASSNSVTLAYDPDHARSRQTSTVGSVATVTLYMNDAAANVMAENVKVGTAASQWKNYIVADGHAVAQRPGRRTRRARCPSSRRRSPTQGSPAASPTRRRCPASASST